MNDVIVTIPAFEPDASLVSLASNLLRKFTAIVIVDDGSTRSTEVFDHIARMKGVVLLRHPTNRGKGAALKTAFAEILRRFPCALGTVTVDADGQHLPDDVDKVAQSLSDVPGSLALGVRSFARDIPFRSRLGNLWTCCEFRLLTGRWIADTQTGLRAIPLSLLPRFLKLPGERYEYEIRMLVDAVRHLDPPRQIPITTVYADGNSTSHFRPLADTFRTQRALFAAALGSR